MNGLIIFFLMTSAIQVVPMVIITLSINYGTPVPSALLPNSRGNRPRANRGLRSIGVARLEEFLQLYDVDVKNSLSRFSAAACILQLITVFLILLVIIFEVPLPFIPNIDDSLEMATMYDLLMFAVTSGVLQLIPMFVLVLALIYGPPALFIKAPRETHPPSSTEIIQGEEQFRDFAAIRLTRFEDCEKKFVYAHIYNHRLEIVFKLVLIQGKEVGARTQCYQYSDDDASLKRVIPAPITIRELEELFNLA